MQVGVKILHYNIALTNITNLNKPLKLYTLAKIVGKNLGDIVTCLHTFTCLYFLWQDKTSNIVSDSTVLPMVAKANRQVKEWHKIADVIAQKNFANVNTALRFFVAQYGQGKEGQT